jgi:hypothetical protein
MNRPAVVAQGFLVKKGGGTRLLGRTSEKKRYFVLFTDGQLAYFAHRKAFMEREVGGPTASWRGVPSSLPLLPCGVPVPGRPDQQCGAAVPVPPSCLLPAGCGPWLQWTLCPVGAAGIVAPLPILGDWGEGVQGIA